MKTLFNYLLITAFVAQPLIHADDSLFTSMTGWVSRNLSTIGICTAFSVLNWYLIKNNNREKSIPVSNPEPYVTQIELNQRLQQMNGLINEMRDVQKQIIRDTCTQVINDSFTNTPFDFSARQRDHIKWGYYNNTGAQQMIDAGNNLTRLSFLVFSLHKNNAYWLERGFETADLNHRRLTENDKTTKK